MQDKGGTGQGLGSGPVFPKRFFKEAGIAPASGGGFALQLDGRPARTPARRPIVLPTAAAAQAVADEWAAVTMAIDPRAMPMTRLVNSVIDGVADTQPAVLDEVVRYAGSDLLIYRADSPDELVAAQEAGWDPVLAWARDALGVVLRTGEGVVFVPQTPEALTRLEAAAAELVGTGPAAPFRLAALHVVTTLTGSALLGLAVLARRLTPAEAWSAAHVDEDHQIAQWGADEEAAERRAGRWVEMETAARLDRLTRGGDA